MGNRLVVVILTLPLLCLSLPAMGAPEKKRVKDISVGDVCVVSRAIKITEKKRGSGKRYTVASGTSVVIEETPKGRRALLTFGEVKGWFTKKRLLRLCSWTDKAAVAATSPEESQTETPVEEVTGGDPPDSVEVPQTAAGDSSGTQTPKETLEEGPSKTTTEVQPDASTPEPSGVAPTGLPESGTSAPQVSTPSVGAPRKPVWETPKPARRQRSAFRMAVMDVNVLTEGLDPVVGESLSAVIAAELTSRSGGRYNVLSRNDLRSLVGQQIEAQSMGCLEPKCLVDLGKLATADQIVTSSVAELGDELVFTMELLDVTLGQVLRRQAVSWRGEPHGLVDLCRPYVARLIEGTAAQGYEGGIQVLASEDGAKVHLNDKALGATPLQVYFDVPIGRHRVRIQKEGFLLFNADVVVHHNETTLLQAQLVDEDSITPWYRKWWVWTGVSALVAGAVTTGYLLQSESTSLDIVLPLPEAPAR